MKTTLLKLTWGMIIICLVGLTLACIQGHVTFDRFMGWKSFTIFVCLSILSFVSYFLSGTKKWGWLFPALIFAALALNTIGVFSTSGRPIAAFPILLSIAIPFYVGYLSNRKQWELLIPAWLLSVLAIIPPLVPLINEDLLIALVLYSISLPFLVGCLTNPGCRWSLVIATFFGFLGLFSIVESFIHGNVVGPAILLVAAFPFILVSYRSKKNWWALIPSGIFTTVGLIALLDRLVPAYDFILVGNYQFGIYTGLLFLGLAATFGLVWRLRDIYKTNWAIYPSIGFLAASILAVFMGKNFLRGLPVITILVIGLVIVIDAFRKMRVSQQPSS